MKITSEDYNKANTMYKAYKLFTGRFTRFDLAETFFGMGIDAIVKNKDVRENQKMILSQIKDCVEENSKI